MAIGKRKELQSIFNQKQFDVSEFFRRKLTRTLAYCEICRLSGAPVRRETDFASIQHHLLAVVAQVIPAPDNIAAEKTVIPRPVP
jgi:hypothetical protein